MLMPSWMLRTLTWRRRMFEVMGGAGEDGHESGDNVQYWLSDVDDDGVL